eukprot:75783-Amphidinium_carterae.1
MMNRQTYKDTRTSRMKEVVMIWKEKDSRIEEGTQNETQRAERQADKSKGGRVKRRREIQH